MEGLAPQWPPAGADANAADVGQADALALRGNGKAYRAEDPRCWVGRYYLERGGRSWPRRRR